MFNYIKALTYGRLHHRAEARARMVLFVLLADQAHALVLKATSVEATCHG
jgi:hypothetical protein